MERLIHALTEATRKADLLWVYTQDDGVACKEDRYATRFPDMLVSISMVVERHGAVKSDMIRLFVHCDMTGKLLYSESRSVEVLGPIAKGLRDLLFQIETHGLISPDKLAIRIMQLVYSYDR